MAEAMQRVIRTLSDVSALEAESSSCVGEPEVDPPGYQELPDELVKGLAREGHSGDFGKLFLPVFLPQVLVFAVNMLATPVLPGYMIETFGVSAGTTGLAMSCFSLAPVVLDMPGNIILDRVGPHYLAVFGVLCLVCCGLLGLTAGIFSCFPLLLASRILNGAGQSTWQMSRVYLLTWAPPELRAKALSIVGGMQRVGALVAPLIGSAVAFHFSIYAVFFGQFLCGLIILPMAVLPMLAPTSRCIPEFIAGHRVGSKKDQTSALGMLRCVTRNVGDYATAGFSLLLLNLLRQAKDFLIIMKVRSVGGGVQDCGFAVTCAYVFDVLCSPISGILMGQYGRKFSTVPALLVLGTACGLLGTPLANSLPMIMPIACLGGAGNGLSSGLAMCVGSDLAVERERQARTVSKAEFLGPWREMMDVGQLLGPVVVGTVMGSLSLPSAAAVCFTVGAFGAAFVVLYVAETRRSS